MKPKVVVTREIPEEGLKRLRTQCEVWVSPSPTAPTEEELIAWVRDADALLCLLSDPVTERVLEAGKHLKIVANYAVGYDNIDVAAATARGIMVTNTPGVLTTATAELAVALIFAVARRVVEADRFTREGKFVGWHPRLFLGVELEGKTLGILGAGRIGQAVARKMHGIGMNILYHSRKPKPELEAQTGARFVNLPTLLEESDVLSIHVPLTPETRGMIGERELRRMKPTAILINTARGAVVDEQALIRALQERWIWGAGLDVYAQEPKVPDALKALPNVVLLPHIGSATQEARTKMAVMAAENILAALSGKRPPNLVNPEVLAQPKEKRA